MAWKLKQYKPQIIDSFSGEYSWLSNFELVEIDTGNHYGKFPSVEVAFQAMKSKDPEVHDLMRHMDPGHAKRYGRKHIELREDWDRVKLIYMGWFCWLKFSNEDLKAKLFATGDATLIEGNNWGDTYWGVCNGKGENHLGDILMSIREDMKEVNSHLNNIHFRFLLNDVEN